MNASLRSLGTRADAVSAPPLDVTALVAAGESRVRRRRRTVVAAVTAGVLAVVGGAVLAAPGSPQTAPPAGPDSKQHGDLVKTQPAQRQLTYSVGTTIHWGGRTIDVEQQTNRSPGGRRVVDYVDATDDGAVFVIGQAAVRDQGGLGVPYGPAAVWFTDGSAPVRIGTTYGSRVRGFGIAPTAAGSTLAWIERGTRSSSGAVVVYDTGQMKELARLGDGAAVPLAVYDDVVYWSPDGGACARYLWGAAYGCSPTARVMRFDTGSGRQSPVSRADYEAERRSRPGLLAGRSGDRQTRRGVVFLSFVQHGDRLVAGGVWEAGERSTFAATVPLTGLPLRLRHPARDAPTDAPHVLQMTQWLDPDRVVLLDEHGDETDLVICRLSTGGCRVALRVPNAEFTAPGPAVSHG